MVLPQHHPKNHNQITELLLVLNLKQDLIMDHLLNKTIRLNQKQYLNQLNHHKTLMALL